MARCTTNEPRSALRESVAPRHSARGPTELRARNDRATRAQGPLVRSAAREREHTAVHGDLHFLGRGEHKLDVRQGDGELVEHARKRHRVVAEAVEEEAHRRRGRQRQPVLVDARRDDDVPRVARHRHLRLRKRELPPRPVRSGPGPPRPRRQRRRRPAHALDHHRRFSSMKHVHACGGVDRVRGVRA